LQWEARRSGDCRGVWGLETGKTTLCEAS